MKLHDDPTPSKDALLFEEQRHDSCRVPGRGDPLFNQVQERRFLGRGHVRAGLLQPDAVGGNPAVDEHECAVVQQMDVVERPPDERGPVVSAQTSQLHGFRQLSVPVLEFPANTVHAERRELLDNQVVAEDTGLEQRYLGDFKLDNCKTVRVATEIGGGVPYALRARCRNCRSQPRPGPQR